MRSPLNVKFLNSYCCFGGVWCLLRIGNYQLTQQNIPEDFSNHVEHYFDFIWRMNGLIQKCVALYSSFFFNVMKQILKGC